MKKTYYLTNPGILERKDNSLKFIPITESDNGEELGYGQARFLPVENVADFYVFGSLRGNSALFNFLGQKGISMHFFDYYNNYTGSFMSRDSLLSGRMLLAQTAYYRNKQKRVEIARRIIEGASHNMLTNLQYYGRRGKQLDNEIAKIKDLREQLAFCSTVPQVMGIEGMIRQVYYDGFDIIINDFKMSGRSKQPPENEVNAMVSFGNMFCYVECLRAIHMTQLNPTISYLHTPGERRYSLALDVAEIFKPIIVDRVIFMLLNKKEIQAQHFEKEINRCLLNKKGRDIFVKALDVKLEETFEHRHLKRKVSFRHLIKLECYKLAKHLLEIEEYKPFKMYW